ncbi:hypothetical protein GCM10010466_40220 [Planomonospora alba]|uniref:Pyruvate kinase n=1 Tax=Planomonospora alba TaxID=161354 RepID=A0ABP6NDV7_9ACTN
MTAVMVELGPRPAPAEEIELIDDVDAIVASSKCSCSAGDDAPY